MEFGQDVTREALLECYDAVIYATGAMVDRRLGIPGEDLVGSLAATDFVNWYCGHPDAAGLEVDLSADAVAVIGVGNVAVDVVRILAKTAEELRATDVPDQVLTLLGGSGVRRIHMIGRRGPAQAKFTTKELRELGALPGAEVHVRAEDMRLDPASAALAETDRHVRANVKVMNEWAARPAGDLPRRLDVRFWLRPVEILGTDRVEGLRLEHTGAERRGPGRRHGRVRDAARTHGAAVGGIPERAAARRAVRPGRVRRPERGRPGARRGRPPAARGVRRRLDQARPHRRDRHEQGRRRRDRPRAARRPGRARAERPSIETLLESRGVRVVTYDDWLGIDAGEAALARSLDRGERVKLAGWEALRRAYGHDTEGLSATRALDARTGVSVAMECRYGHSLPRRPMCPLLSLAYH